MVAVVSFSTSVVSAQEAGRVAILDVAKVFKENRIFADGLLVLKSQADQLKSQIVAEQDKIKKEVMELRGEPASEKRNQKEAELEQRHTRLRTSTRQNEAELLSREARVYFDTYRKMQAVVETMAKEHDISLVLRFDSGSIDATDRNDVISGLQRPVVFHRHLDLTAMVSNELNKRMSAAAAAPISTLTRH